MAPCPKSGAAFAALAALMLWPPGAYADVASSPSVIPESPRGIALAGGAILFVAAMSWANLRAIRKRTLQSGPEAPVVGTSRLGGYSLLLLAVGLVSGAAGLSFWPYAVGLSLVLALAAVFQPNRRKPLAYLALLPWLLFVVMLVEDALQPPRPRVASVKANMHTVQLGVEQYAGDNYGNYPDGIADSNFEWARYVPGLPQDPFALNEPGAHVMEPDVKTAGPNGGPVYVIAQAYQAPGRPGSMRYFADTAEHTTYAIIGYGKNGLPIKETSDKGSKNYVVHN